jgi:hypothetical protein
VEETLRSAQGDIVGQVRVLPVRAACARCMGTLHGHAAFARCMHALHARSACTLSIHTVMLRPVTRPKHLIGGGRSSVEEMLRFAQGDIVGQVRVLPVRAACTHSYRSCPLLVSDRSLTYPHSRERPRSCVRPCAKGTSVDASARRGVCKARCDRALHPRCHAEAGNPAEASHRGGQEQRGGDASLRSA